MREQLMSLLIWVSILAPIVVFARQIQQVRRGAMRGFKAGVLFFSYSIIPVLLYALLFFTYRPVEGTACAGES